MSNAIDPRPTLQAPDDDPHLWLEEVEGERALRYVGEQNARTLALLADKRFEADRDGEVGFGALGEHHGDAGCGVDGRGIDDAFRP